MAANSTAPVYERLEEIRDQAAGIYADLENEGDFRAILSGLDGLQDKINHARSPIFDAAEALEKL